MFVEIFLSLFFYTCKCIFEGGYAAWLSGCISQDTVAAKSSSMKQTVGSLFINQLPCCYSEYYNADCSVFNSYAECFYTECRYAECVETTRAPVTKKVL